MADERGRRIVLDDSEILSERITALRQLVDERDHRYEDRFTATDDKTSLALTSSKEAVAKAEAATEKRFDAVNEFRKTLADQATGFMPRQEYIANHQSMQEKIETQKESMTKEISALRDNVSKEIQSLRESRSETEGKSSGFNASWGIAISIAFLTVAILALFFTRH